MKFSFKILGNRLKKMSKIRNFRVFYRRISNFREKMEFFDEKFRNAVRNEFFQKKIFEFLILYLYRKIFVEFFQFQSAGLFECRK